MSHSSHKIRRLSSWGLPQPSHTVQSRQRQPFCSIVFDIWPHTQHNTHTNLFDRNPFTHYNSRLVTKDRIAHAYPQQIWLRISTVYCTSKYDHLKIATSPGAYMLPPNIWFLGPTWVHTPNGTWTGSAVYEGLTAVTKRDTHRDTCSNRHI